MTGTQIQHQLDVENIAGLAGPTDSGSWIDHLTEEELAWAEYISAAHPTTTIHVVKEDAPSRAVNAFPTMGERKRDDFEKHARKDPVRKGAGVFARQFLARLGITQPDTAGPSKAQAAKTIKPYLQKVGAFEALLICFAEHRERTTSFRTLCSKKRLNQTSGSQKQRLRRNFAHSRDIIQGRIEATLEAIGFTFATDDERKALVNLTFAELVEFADRVDHRDFRHNVTDTYRCRSTACALAHLAEDFGEDEDSDEEDDETQMASPFEASPEEMTSFHAYSRLRAEGLISDDVTFIDFLNGDITIVEVEVVATAHIAVIDLCGACACDCDELCKEDGLTVYASLAAYIEASRLS